MTEQEIKNFFKSEFFIFGLFYAITFLLSSYYKYIEFLLIPILLVAFIMLDVEQSLYFFLFTQPFYVSELLRRPAIIAEAIYFTILFVKVIIGIKQKKYTLNKKLGILILAFTAYSIFISLFHRMAVYSIVYIFFLPIFYMIFITRKEYNLKTLTRVIFYALVLSCVLSLLTLFKTYFICFNNIFRFRGFYGSPNTLYMTALLGLSCAMYLFFKNQIDIYEYLALYFSLSILTLITQSKSGIVIWAILTIISAVLYVKQDVKKHIWLVLSALVLLVLTLLIFKDLTLAILERFTNISSTNFFSQLTTGRDEIWLAYIKAIFSNPANALFGHGMLSKYVYVPAQERERAQHNLYIFLLYKFGIIGLIFLGFIIAEFIKASHKTKPAFINYIPLIYFLIVALVDNTFMYPQFYFIVAMALFDTNEKQPKTETSSTQATETEESATVTTQRPIKIRNDIFNNQNEQIHST